MSRKLVYGLIGMIMVLSAGVSADVAFSDDFTDGNRDGWYRVNYGSNVTVSVVDDPNVGGIGLGSGNALEFVDTATTTAPTTLRIIVANTETVVLSEVDDYITMSFDMRYVNNPVVAANFRFGFFDSKGTKIATDQSTDSTPVSVRDDVGYCGRLAVGPSTTMQIYGEGGSSGGLMGGTEQSYGTSETLTTPFNNNNKHHIELTYKLIPDETVPTTLRPQFYLTIDGQTLNRNSMTLAPYTTFNEIGIASSQSGNDFRIDNVQVTSNKVFFNQLPVVDAGLDRVLASTSGTLIMAATATDPEAQPLTFKWTATGPGTVTFAPSDAIKDPEVSFSAGGTYTLQLAVTDDVLQTQTDTLTVVVQDSANNALLAHWDFETLTPAEPNVYDATANHYNGTWILADPNADPNYVDGWITGASPDLAAKFYAGEYISIVPAAGSALNTGLQGGLTVACWVRVDNAAAFQASDRIIDKGDWALIAAPSGSGSVKFRLSNQANVGVSAVTPVTDGNWHHVAGVYDGFTMKIYIDGIEEGTGSTTGILPVTTVKLTMGADTTGSQQLEHVAVDDIRVYNYGLDAAGVAALAAMGDNLAPYITTLTVSKMGVILPEDTIALSATVSNPDGDPLTYAWTQVSGPGAVSFSAASAISTDAAFPAVGRYILRLSVSDATAVVSADTSVITVYPVGWNGEMAYMPYDNQDPNDVFWGCSATLFGTPTFTSGKIGGAIKFSGTNNDHLEYDSWIAKADATDFTFMTWVRRDAGGTADQDLAGTLYNGTPDDGFRIMLRDSTKSFRLYVGDNISSGIYEVFDAGNNSYVVGQWMHFAFTFKYNGGNNNEVKIYVDGNLKTTIATNQEIGPNTTVPFTVGMRALNNSNHFCGAVDELYLYERVLPQQEIAAKAGLNIPPVVDAGEPKKIILPTTSVTLDGSASDTDAFTVLWSVVEGPGGVSFAPANNAVTTATFTQVGDYILRLTGTDSYNATALDDVCVKVRPAGFDGMEAYLQFENADPNLALASTVGIGYTGTAYGDPNAGTVEVGSAKSKLGSGALNLFGVDEYVEYSKFLGSNPSLTVSAWFNCRDIAAGGRIIDKWSNSGSGLGWMIRVRNGDSRLAAMIGSAYNGPGTYLLSPTAAAVAANEWVHAVLTFDAGVMRLYQNGALLNEETEVPFSPADFVTPVNIGRRNNSTEYFNGLIDEVRIYDYALSIAQVKALYAGDGGLPWNTCINSTLAGDLTQDCRVDMQDMAALSTDWQSTYNITTLTSVAQTWLDCDDLDLSKCL